MVVNWLYLNTVNLELISSDRLSHLMNLVQHCKSVPFDSLLQY